MIENHLDVSSIDDAVRLLNHLEAGEVSGLSHVVFRDDFAKIAILLEGADYHGSVPAELARGLWEFQEAFYKAAAYALYGVEDARRLTREQRRQFEFVFEVKQGSTDIVAKLGDFLNGLSKGFESMDSKHKTITLITIAVALVIGWGAVSVLEQNKAVKLEAVKAELEIGKELERTKQFEVITRAVGASGGAVEAFNKASEKGARAIIEAAPDADKVKVGKVSFDKHEIEEVNQRASRDKPTATILIEEFRILRIDMKDGITRVWLHRANGMEFAAWLQDEDLTPEDLQKIWDAARNRQLITLQVNATVLRGNVKNATVLSCCDRPSTVAVAKSGN